MYFLNVCRLIFFIFFTSCRLAKNKSQNRRSPSKSIFFVYSYFVPAILFIFFTVFGPFGIPNESLHIAPPPHVRVTLKYISMYFLIVCRLVFLFSLKRAVWQKTRSQNRRRRSKSIFFVFSYFCACYPFYFFTLCRLAFQTSLLHIAPPPHVRVTLKYILCISLLCAG